jgi:hypothetical protein
MKKFLVISFVFIAVVLSACEKPFGDKTDLEFIEVPDYESQPVSFVPIQPALKGFSNATDIIMGYDELIYVADNGQGKIFSYDQSGRSLGSYSVPGVKAIAQDRSMEVLALGTKDTTIGGNTYTLDALYRLSLQGDGGYGISNAKIIRIVVHPFYYKTSFTASDKDIHFNGISVMADNSYYITRSDTSNEGFNRPGELIPDNAVLVFNPNDKFITSVNVSTESGLISDYFKKPFGITTLSKPPQSPNVKQGGDFIFASVSTATTYKVQYIRFQSSEFGSTYTVNTSLAGTDTSKADRFLYEPNRFVYPQRVSIAGDGTNYIFVTDAVKDSVYLFTLTGLEGVQPPAGSISSKNVNVSFGGTGSGLKQFRRPTGVMYHNKILYICDSGNGRVSRFKLTTDFNN